MKLWRIASLILVLSCTSTISQVPQTPTLSEIQPIMLELPMPQTVQEFLQFGFWAFERQQFIPAIWAFTSALKTGELNDRGRALCYWHVGTAHKLMGNEDESAEAMFFFAIVGMDLLEGPDVEFAESVDLAVKVNEAKEYVEDIWRSRHERVLRTSSRDPKDRQTSER